MLSAAGQGRIGWDGQSTLGLSSSDYLAAKEAGGPACRPPRGEQTSGGLQKGHHDLGSCLYEPPRAQLTHR